MDLCVHHPPVAGMGAGAFVIAIPDADVAMYLWEGFRLADFARLSPETLGAYWLAYDHWLKDYPHRDASACDAMRIADHVVAHVVSTGGTRQSASLDSANHGGVI